MAYPVTVVKKGKPVIVWLGPDSVVPKPTNKFDAEGRASIFNVLPSYLWFIRGVQKGAKVDRHDGWDLAVTNCQPIYSPFDGIVVKAKASLDPKTGKGYGYYVDIKHTLKNGEEVITRYAHMRPQWVQLKQYQPVKAGQIVGFTSDYGAPGHYHLHFEVHQGGHIIQPSEYFYIPKTKEEGMTVPVGDPPSSEALGEDKYLPPDEDEEDEAPVRNEEINDFENLFNPKL